MKVSVPFEGGCVCGAVRYVCDVAPTSMFNCHCRDCQRLGGSAYAAVIVVPLSALCFSRGAPKRFATTRRNGSANLRGFCSECGSRLTIGEDPGRDIVGVLAASLDDPSWFQPTANIFVSHAQPWDVMDPALLHYDYYAKSGK